MCIHTKSKEPGKFKAAGSLVKRILGLPYSESLCINQVKRRSRPHNPGMILEKHLSVKMYMIPSFLCTKDDTLVA